MFSFSYSAEGLHILNVTADGKERGPLRGQISHNGRFGCDCCTLSKVNQVYPPFKPNGDLRIGTIRTHERHLELLSPEYHGTTVDER